MTLRFKDALSNFLHDKDYYITLFENKIHIFRYNKIVKVATDEMIISVKNFNLIVHGRNLTVSQMDKVEILVTGEINEVIKKYE